MRNFVLIFMLLISFGLKSQIGYQISLLDTATGQPRADEAVQVSLELTDNTGAIICSETKTAVSDDFGILSLTIGNSSTFDNVDWTKLPFYISASVDGVLLGKSQVLTVPVAEYAKHTGSLTTKILCSKTWSHQDQSISFGSNNSFSWSSGNQSHSGTYNISGNIVALEYSDESGSDSLILAYIASKRMLVGDGLRFR